MKSICVFCGSSLGDNEIYRKVARELAMLFVDKNITLIYGGGNIGLMGELARTVRDLGGKVIGIIPEFLMIKEVGLVEGCELHVVQNMHERKALMARYADAFIAIPGGIGTFEELFEVLTWKQLHLHEKPIGLLNTNGYYNHLLSFLDHSKETGFFKDRGLMKVSTSAKELVDLLHHEHSGISTNYDLT
ncbi:TIGR00730 family Rossman fold protein [Solitalea sp. MAHUQ-68]|uniref:Cytokinin riboside 5'-monophosphate phosphoribohydrolase n=1 Tax=Solitalea agri TaxID=2953739 RepID=A0A9X2F232_9SPHI|nr:TIGR00730 family Rossman fold protein [Solitalea agri]MCO4292770.1 TIGR00730 family Rossman fold protein [Solitalea agri]